MNYPRPASVLLFVVTADFEDIDTGESKAAVETVFASSKEEAEWRAEELLTEKHNAMAVMIRTIDQKAV